MLELFLAEFVISASVYFFFLQSPILFGFMGRDKFVPIMMHMTKHCFFFYIPIASFIAALLSLFNNNNNFSNIRCMSALASMIFANINTFVIVPQALKAGAATFGNRKGDNTKSAADFVSTGGAKQGTKFWHRTVVLFVLLMVGSSVIHTSQLVAV